MSGNLKSHFHVSKILCEEINRQQYGPVIPVPNAIYIIHDPSCGEYLRII